MLLRFCLSPSPSHPRTHHNDCRILHRSRPYRFVDVDHIFARVFAVRSLDISDAFHISDSFIITTIFSLIGCVLLRTSRTCRHPLPILNISEHLTRLKLQTDISHPLGMFRLPCHMNACHLTCSQVIGALLGTQNGRDVEIVNTFELATNAAPGSDTPTDAAAGQPLTIDVQFLIERRDQCKLVFHRNPCGTFL